MYKCKSCTSTENIKCCLCNECPLNTYEVVPCTFSSNTACIQCPGNLTTLNTNTKNINGCRCPLGSIRNPNTSVFCAPCTAGKYSNEFDALECRICPEGLFSAAGASICSHIPILTYQNITPDKIIYNFENVKIEDKGYIWNQYDCPENHFKEERATQMTNSLILYQLSCTVCDERVVNCINSECYGIIQNGTCTPCPLNQIAINQNAIKCVCKQGFYGTSCMECPEGFFNEFVNSSSCQQCPLGYFSGNGSSECSIIPVVAEIENKTTEIKIKYTRIKPTEKRFVWEMTICPDNFYKKNSESTTFSNGMISFIVTCSFCQNGCGRTDCTDVYPNGVCNDCAYPFIRDLNTNICVCRPNHFRNDDGVYCTPCFKGLMNTELHNLPIHVDIYALGFKR